MFGFLKKLFGSGRVDEAQEAASKAVEQAVEQASERVSEGVADIKETVATAVDEAQEAVTDMVQDAESTAPVEAAAEAAPAAAPEQPQAPVKMTDYIDRDEFSLPRSANVDRAAELIEAQKGKAGLAKGLRIYEYAMAGALARDIRVDRELLVLASLFVSAGDNAGEAAYAFCIKHGMWDALAEKVKNAIESHGDSSVDDRETQALALGVAAEAAGGNVPYVNAANSAETRSRHAA